MLCSFLRGVVKVGRPQFLRSEVCEVLCSKALASFFSRSLFLWARCCCSHPGGGGGGGGGRILVHLEGISRKPRSVKRRKTDSPERDQSAPTKVQKLEAPSSLLVQRLERASSPLASPVLEPKRDSLSLAKVPPVLGPLPPSEPIVEVGNPSGGDGILSLAAVPITVWKSPSESVKSPLGKSPEPRRRTTPTTAEDKDSLLSNAELAAGVVSSILKDSDIVRSKELSVDEALASSFQGFALVSL